MNTQTHRIADKSEIYAMVSFGHKEREGERNSNVFAFAYSGMVDAANVIDPDIKIEWHGPNAWDPILEIKAIQELTIRQVDGIIVTAADKSALDESINVAMRAGIPVINFDADSPASERLTVVATDNYKAGYLAGKTMAEWLGGRGDVAVCTMEHAEHLIERLRGFKDALSQHAPQANIYVSHDSGNIAVDESGHQDFTEYRQSYIRMIQAHPEIRGMFATYSSPGGGAAEAVEELGLHGKVQILAFDFDEIIIKLVEMDKIRATVGQDAYMMGYASMILLHAARHASKMPAKADGDWRAPALADFLAAYPRIHKNTAAKLRDIISRLEGIEAGESGLIDTGARILGKQELLDILAGDFEDMRDSISEKIEFLGRQVEVRKQAERELHRFNEELEQRVQVREQQVRTSTEVSQEIAAAPDLNELFRRVVTLIKERFNFYHAQIFRYDPALDTVVLVTGYGEAGQHMLADRHQLAMGRGVVGTAAASGQSILATDVTQDKDWRPNLHLPDTKGELAVPIKLRDKVLGILDVQSDRAGALNADDRLLLEGLCGQIASALESTRLLEVQRHNETELAQALDNVLQFKSAFEHTNVGMAIVTTDGRFISANQALCEMVGYTREELQLKRFGELTHPDDMSSSLEYLRRALAGEIDTFRAEKRYLHKNGEVIWIELSTSVLRDTDQQPLYFISQIQDIRQRRLAEDLIRAKEAQLSEALQIAKLAYWEYDVEKDLFLFNDQFYAIFHTTAEREGGYQLSSAQYAGKFVYPEDLPVVGSEIERALKSTDRHYSRDLVHRIQYADGGVGYMSVSINIDRDEQGHILRYYGANQDITERQLAEVELEKFKLGLERSNSAIFITDPQGVISYVNPAFEKIYGYSREAAIGQTPRILKSGVVTQEQYHDFWATLLHGQTVAGEIINRTKDGQLLSIEGNNNPILDDNGNVIGFLGMHTDITARKQAELAVRRSEAELSQALQIAKLAYWEYDVEKDLFLFNDQFYAIFHTTAEREGGYQLSSAQYAGKFVYPDDLPVVGSEIERALNSTDRHYSRDLVHRIQYADGGVGYMSVSINIDRDEQGHILRYYGANQDITEREQTKEALAQEQSLMQALMNSVTDQIYFKDLQSRFLRVSKSQVALFSLSDPAQVVGKTDFDFFTEEHARPAYEDEQEIIRTGQPITKEERETWSDRPDTWVSTTKLPLRDEAGNIVGTFGISRDITERRRAEETLSHERNLLRTLIDTLPDSIYAKDTESRFTLANLTEIQLGGATTFDELRGKNDFDRYPRELAEQYFAAEQPILRDGIPQIDHEERGLDNMGNPRWHLSTKVPLRDSQGNIVGLVGTTRDITASKQAEAERERLLREQQQRALQLQTASEVSRAASSILSLDELLPQVVELMRARFGFYYVGLFLTDEPGQQAVLRAGTGAAGQQMLANGHRLEIGGASMISQCLVQQQARIALDVGEEAIRFDNPLLPLTRSEMALPLTSRGHIIGAMTIQSDRSAAFTSDDVTVLQSMADQISNAVENARLYEQTQAALADTDQLLQASAELNISQTYNDVLDVIREFTILGHEAQTVAINVFDRPWTDSQTPVWIELIGYTTKRSSGMDVGTRFPIALFPSAKALLHPDTPSIIEDFDTAPADPNTYALFVKRLASKSVVFLPLVVGGQWFGYINVLYAEPTHFNEAEVRRLMAMVGQAAVAVQNLRNLASAQQALTETDASYRATQAIGRAQSIEAILEATSHVIDLLGMTRAILRVVTQRDVSNAVMAVDMYGFYRLNDQWVPQPVVRAASISDSADIQSLQHNPEAVVIFADAQNPNSVMPDEVRQSLLAGTLRGSISTSVSVQNEILGFLSFSGPQALNESAEQRLRITIRTLSDQAAVALQNRLLYEQTRAALQEVDAINRRLTGEAWEMYLHHQTGQQVISFTDDSQTAPELLSQLDGPLTAGEISIEPAEDDQSEATVSAPILLRGQPIGALRMRTPLDSWDKDTEAILTGIAGHIAQAVENARLIEQTQRTASRERAINEINARVRQTVTIDSILETAVKELGKSLTATHVFARVSRPEIPDDGHDRTG